MEKPELLMPAGNLEKLEYAVNYGADAVYLGVVDFSLRAMRKGELITLDNLKQAIDLAHKFGKKAYLTLNIFAFNNDISLLEKAMDKIKDSNPDAIILSDFGIFRVVRRYMENVPIHVSTQTNTLNYESVKFWEDLGATRAILARELPIKDVKEIRKNVPNMELEVFVQGSQCVSFSGRCLLSDYMTGGERKANHGNCAQPCRWSYKLLEETRPGQYFEINQDDRGTHILCPKDLCLVEHLDKLIDAGVNSFKVEGRTKSLYYVSAVTKTYREAIDSVWKDKNADMKPYFDELLKVGNRGYTTGFYLGEHDSSGYSYDISKGLAGADFLCEFHGEVEKDGKRYFKVITKNKFQKNEDIEIITPTERFVTQAIDIKNGDWEDEELANTNDEFWINFSTSPQSYKYAIARTVGIKQF